MLQALTAPPREHLDEDEVAATLSLDYGARVRHGVDVLDTSDTVVAGESLPVDFDAGGEVVWSYRPPDPVVDGRSDGTTDTAAVRRTATLPLAGPVSVPLMARRLRVWTELLSPAGNWVRFHLITGVVTVPPLDDDGTTIRRTLALADKTWRYQNRLLIDPLEIAAATNPVAWVAADLASRFGDTALFTASTVTLDAGKVFEAGESMLDVYNALLETAGYDQLTCDENGTPTSVPLADLAGRGAEIIYGPGAGKIVTPGHVEPLLASLPNVVRFVARQGPSLAEEGNGYRTKRNESTGPGSIAERDGEEVTLVVEVEAEDQTALDAIADADAQRYFAGGGLRFAGKIGLNPRHGDRDVIGLDKPRLGLAGTWLLTEWRFPLHPIREPDSALMSITCEKRV